MTIHSLHKPLLAGFLMVWLISVTPLSAQDYAGKRIFYVNSYHTGFPASDKTAAAIRRVLSGRGIVLRAMEMDTKRNPDIPFIEQAAARARAAIEAFEPDVVIVSDDNAVKYLLEPFYKGSDIPFVFCCVNWDASVYGLPYRNATGIVEVVLIGELMRHLRRYAKGPRVGFLGGDRYSEHRNRQFYESRFGIDFAITHFAKTFSDWKAAFRQLQSEVDMVMLTNHAGVAGWDDTQARDFVEREIKVPVGTEHEWEMPFALVGVAKDFGEMGTWAAQTALRILDGVPPDQIAITANKRGRLYFNRRLARRLGIDEAPPLATLID